MTKGNRSESDGRKDQKKSKEVLYFLAIRKIKAMPGTKPVVIGGF